MSDLISRSELLKEIEKYKFGAISNDAEREYIKKTILDFIICQPTAYDIDKVVEELEEVKMRYFLTIANTGDEKSDFAYENVGNALDKAIEIVKQDCAGDDVCEWKLEDDNLMTGCGDYFNLYDNCTDKFKFCPTCGKKIKVVE